MRTLFIVDGSLDNPLLHSQGIPLIKRLSRVGIRSWIFSFEKSRSELKGSLAYELTSFGIRWLPIVVSPNVSGSQRVQMIANGFFKAFSLCRQEDIDVVHCRSYRPAVIGSLLKTFLGTGFLFDMRGLLPDELVADGRWKAGSLKYRLAKFLERWMILHADAITTTSPQFRDAVLSLPYFPRRQRAEEVFSIPNCVDVTRFKPDQQKREQVRQELGWENRFIIIFAGDAFRYQDTFSYIHALYNQVRSILSSTYLVMAVSGQVEEMRKRIQASGLTEDHYTLLTVNPAEMPGILCAADLGLSFLRCQTFAHHIVSPVKLGEYLACGLPVVINPGIGDTGRIIDQYQAGVVVDPENEVSSAASVHKVLEMIQNDPNLPTRCREAAICELSLDYAVQEYLRVYELVASRKARRRRS
jgi:glycosyltransferase involved in cell wall biosynthesis